MENEVRALVVKYEDYLEEWEQKFLSSNKLHIHPPPAFDFIFDRILAEIIANVSADLDDEDNENNDDENDSDVIEDELDDINAISRLAMHKAVLFVLHVNKGSHKKYHQYARCGCFDLSEKDLVELRNA